MALPGPVALVVMAAAAAVLFQHARTASTEELLFESFLSNFSKSYRKDPEAVQMRFKVFQVLTAYRF